VAETEGEPGGQSVGRRRLWLAAVGVLVAAFVVSTVLANRDDDEAPAFDSMGEIMGTSGRDRLAGGPQADAIFGFGGDDELRGGAGGDLIDGGNRQDVIDAGPGDDRIRAYDGWLDTVRCGAGDDVAFVDPVDTAAGCEELREYADESAPRSPRRPPAGGVSQSSGSFPVQGRIVLDEQAYVCRGPVDLDLVKVTMRTTVDDAIRLDQDCSGRIGRIEVDTWTADGIKVQNHGEVAHDLVVESGYVKCHDVYGEYHQDGIQAMGGYRLTFRNLAVDCLGNANLFLNRGGARVSTPTDVVCERCILGPSSAQTLFSATSTRSGTRDTTVCTGRYRAIRIGPRTEAMVDENTTVLPHDDPSCKDVTGRGRGS
jgi:hypothetical protein